MSFKSKVNGVCLSLLPCFVGLTGYFLFTERFIYSVLALLGILACVRARLFMGYRGYRGRLFAVHLTCSTLLIVLLAILSVFGTSALIFLAYVLFFGMSMTGIFLIKGSWHRSL